MLRASSALNKVMETPGKRPQAWTNHQKASPCQERSPKPLKNITETDFLASFGFSVFEAQLKLGRKKAKQGQT